MDLPVITQMLTYLDKVKVLHIEPTNICQAECPQCYRETDINFDKNNQATLTIDQIISAIPINIISNLEKMFLCGVYGDPAACDAIELYKFFRNYNQSIVLGMNTNGALRTTNWWYNLGKILNKQRDYVIFSLDGLSDTNHIYRKNVVWEKAIENAHAYIQAGGNAHWDMLVFQHNEHQVDDCERLAKKLGFKWFRAKVTRRQLTNNLEFPVNWISPKQSHGKINCQALAEQSIYLDCYGKLHPCCFLGNHTYSHVSYDNVVPTWDTDPHPVCKETCSATINTFSSQWQREVQLC